VFCVLTFHHSLSPFIVNVDCRYPVPRGDVAIGLG
jgi:hypothetical protein